MRLGVRGRRRARSALAAYARRRRGHRLYGHWVRRGDLCFDVGANVGERARLFLGLGARVIAVEPQPSCAAALREIGNDRLTIEEVALGSAPSSATLRVAEATTISSLAEGWISRVRESGRFAEFHWEEELNVDVTTLDALIERHGVPAFCKIDVEGYEAEVLEGLSTPIACLSFEFTPEWWEAAERALDRLELLGFAEFNFSIGESLTLLWRDWRARDGLGAFLASVRDDAALFGDVYARLS